MSVVEDAREAQATLARHEVRGVLDVHAADDGALEVTFAGTPTAGAIAEVRRLLAPANVRTVWFEGATSTVDDGADLASTEATSGTDAATPDNTHGGVPCGVCTARPAPWPHRVRTPHSPVAVALTRRLCDTCHQLVEEGHAEGLADRMTGLDLDRDRLVQLANRLR